jgi:hypothetical protein
MVKEVMLDPAKLRECVEFFGEDAPAAELRLEREVKAIDRDIRWFWTCSLVDE